jgi:hypothetical protein
MASPAFAGPECNYPPGSSRETAEWSYKEKLIETYLTTSSGNRYTCGPDVAQNKMLKQAGSRGYFKRICGPLTIVREVTNRNCNFQERAGISRGYGIAAEAQGILAQFECGQNSNIVSDTRHELRDKNGQIFQLTPEYGANGTNLKTSNTCTSNLKTEFYTRTWTVGSTRNSISLTYVSEYPAKSIKQPSL